MILSEFSGEHPNQTTGSVQTAAVKAVRSSRWVEGNTGLAAASPGMDAIASTKRCTVDSRIKRPSASSNRATRCGSSAYHPSISKRGGERGQSPFRMRLRRLLRPEMPEYWPKALPGPGVRIAATHYLHRSRYRFGEPGKPKNKAATCSATRRWPRYFAPKCSMPSPKRALTCPHTTRKPGSWTSSPSVPVRKPWSISAAICTAA